MMQVSSKTVERKSQQAHALNEATEQILDSMRRKDARARFWFTCFFAVLFFVGVAGIYYQNLLANQNKTHIDCIVKLFRTPIHSGQSRFIQNPTGCNVKVTQQ